MNNASSAFLVPLGRKERERVRHGKRAVRPREAAQHRHAHAEEAVAFAVFARAGLEEPLKVDRVCGIGLSAKVPTNGTVASTVPAYEQAPCCYSDATITLS